MDDWRDEARSLKATAGKLLREYKENGGNYDDEDGVVPYTNQDELMSSILETAKTQFGADFSNIKNPMLYYPETGEIILNGTVGSMNDAKFVFKYKDSTGNGCYVYINPLQLTDETLRKLSIINGVYKNWKKDLDAAEDVKPMGLKNKRDDDNPPQRAIVPGDDI